MYIYVYIYISYIYIIYIYIYISLYIYSDIFYLSTSHLPIFHETPLSLCGNLRIRWSGARTCASSTIMTWPVIRSLSWTMGRSGLNIEGWDWDEIHMRSLYLLSLRVYLIVSYLIRTSFFISSFKKRGVEVVFLWKQGFQTCSNLVFPAVTTSYNILFSLFLGCSMWQYVAVVTMGIHGFLLCCIDVFPFAKQLNTAQESVKQEIPTGPKWRKSASFRAWPKPWWNAVFFHGGLIGGSSHLQASSQMSSLCMVAELYML